MYARMDFSPTEQTEDDLFGIDFVHDLSKIDPDEELASATFSIGVISGTDATPAAHFIGSPYVMANPNVDSPLVTLAVQEISGLLPGVYYWLQADALTTSARRISLWSRIAPENPPQVWPG